MVKSGINRFTEEISGPSVWGLPVLEVSVPPCDILPWLQYLLIYSSGPRISALVLLILFLKHFFFRFRQCLYILLGYASLIFSSPHERASGSGVCREPFPTRTELQFQTKPQTWKVRLEASGTNFLADIFSEKYTHIPGPVKFRKDYHTLMYLL